MPTRQNTAKKTKKDNTTTEMTRYHGGLTWPIFFTW